MGLAQGSEPVAEFTLPETSPAEANEGHLLLQWKISGSHKGAFIYELQQADTVDFQNARTTYQGPDNGSYVSGLPTGSTFFRVRLLKAEEWTSPWSDPLEVQVQFPQKWKVLALMASGTFMFVLLVVTILWGRKRTQKGATASS